MHSQRGIGLSCSLHPYLLRPSYPISTPEKQTSSTLELFNALIVLANVKDLKGRKQPMDTEELLNICSMHFFMACLLKHYTHSLDFITYLIASINFAKILNVLYVPQVAEATVVIECISSRSSW